MAASWPTYRPAMRSAVPAIKDVRLVCLMRSRRSAA
jgi:hypothetical protein